MEFSNLMSPSLWQTLGTALQLEAVLNALDCGMVLVDKDDVIQVANDRACRYLGEANERVRGSEFGALFCDRLLPRTKNPQVLLDWLELVRAMRGFSIATKAASNRCEILYEDHELGEITLSLYASSVLGRSGERLAEIIVMDDITESLRGERTLELVTEALRAINTDTELQVILPRLMEVVKRYIPVDAMAVLTAQDDGRGVVLGSVPDGFLGGEGSSGPLTGHLPGDEVLVDIVADVGKSLGEGGAEGRRPSMLPPKFLESVLEAGFRSMVTLPLKLYGRIVGMWILASSGPSTFSLQDMSFLVPVSEHLASAVNNATLPHTSQGTCSAALRALSKDAEKVSEETGSDGLTSYDSTDGVINSKELEVLFRIAQEMKKLLDLRELLDHLANLIAEKMGYSDCLILLPDDEGDDLVIAAGVGMSQGMVGMTIPYGKGISWWVMTNGKPQNIPDVTLDSRYYESVVGVGSEVYVPLEVRGKTLGVLVVQKTEKNGFKPGDVRLMMAVAGHIASALEVAQLHEKVKKSADGDALTGLANRRVFLSSLETAIRRASNDDYGGVVSVGILDVNQLKAVNDRYGHLAGDAVLSSIGSRLGSGFRVCDVVARYGGDEFVVLLPGASKESASRRIEEDISQWVKDTVESPGGEKVGVPGACFGVASYPEDGYEARVVLSVADDRLLRAKRRTGSR